MDDGPLSQDKLERMLGRPLLEHEATILEKALIIERGEVVTMGVDLARPGSDSTAVALLAGRDSPVIILDEWGVTSQSQAERMAAWNLDRLLHGESLPFQRGLDELWKSPAATRALARIGLKRDEPPPPPRPMNRQERRAQARREKRR